MNQSKTRRFDPNFESELDLEDLGYEAHITEENVRDPKENLKLSLEDTIFEQLLSEFSGPFLRPS